MRWLPRIMMFKEFLCLDDDREGEVLGVSFEWLGFIAEVSVGRSIR